MRLTFLIFFSFFFHAFAFYPLKAKVETRLSNPAGITYNYLQQCYYISNINGNPQSKNNNGFISRLIIKEDGNIETTVIIKGGENGITLNAPKGIVFSGDSLYVTDIDVVRVFQPKDNVWQQTRLIKIYKSSFLNDIKIDAMGTLWITDTTLNCVFEQRAPYDKYVRRRYFPNQVEEPVGIELSSDSKRAWVCGLKTDKITELDLVNKKVIDSFSVRLPSLGAISKTSDEELVVTDFKNHSVYHLSQNDKEIARRQVNRSKLLAPSAVLVEPITQLILVCEHKGSSVSIFSMKQEDKK